MSTSARDDECSDPCDEQDAASGGGDEVAVRVAEHGIRRGGREQAADGRDEAEQQALDDERPGEQADHRADLVADDRAEPDADPAPERGARERAEQEQRDLAAVERSGDTAAGEDRVADPEAEPFADDAEHEPGEQARGELRRQTTRERRGVNRNVGRIVPKRYSLVTSRTPASAEKITGEAADAEQVALVLACREMSVVLSRPVSSTNSSTSATIPSTSPSVVRVERIFSSSARVWAITAWPPR